MNQPQIANNMLAIYSQHGEFLTFSFPIEEGWDYVKNFCNRVILFNGDHYVFSSWNSDRGVMHFKKSSLVAEIK